jgi:transposase
LTAEPSFNRGTEEVLRVSELWLLSEAQMRRIEPYFPLSHGIPRVDDRRIVSGIIFVIRNGLRWRDAPAG